MDVKNVFILISVGENHKKMQHPLNMCVLKIFDG